jgi:drug/metabolite transporter (DMT)-like permease
MNKVENEIKRLNFEDMLWGIFIILSILNIVSNNLQKDYVVTNDGYYEDSANNISICVLSILILIYLYFFIRNYNMYNNKDNPMNADLVKVLGSMFFIIGSICLLYFQIYSDDNFIGGPEL